MNEQEKAEQLKKETLYEPDQECPEKDEQGCTWPDCDNCEVDYSEGED
jgi:hypothetical protein